MPFDSPQRYFDLSKTKPRSAVLARAKNELLAACPKHHIIIVHEGWKLKVLRSDGLQTGHFNLYKPGYLSSLYGYDYWIFKEATLHYAGTPASVEGQVTYKSTVLTRCPRPEDFIASTHLKDGPYLTFLRLDGCRYGLIQSELVRIGGSSISQVSLRTMDPGALPQPPKGRGDTRCGT